MVHFHTWCEFQTQPNGERHTTVMDDMQCGYMFSLFAQIKEYRIKKFGKLSDEIPPAGRGHLWKCIKNCF